MTASHDDAVSDSPKPVEEALQPQAASPRPPHRFKPGVSGNPKGRPSGHNRATLAARALLSGELDAICRSLVEKAKSGDVQAQRIVLDKIIPNARELPVNVGLPSIAGAADLPGAMLRVLAAVAKGELLPSEGATLGSILGSAGRAFELSELAARLAEIERRLDGGAP